MKFIYHISGKEQNEIDSQLNSAINNKNFSRWYWAIYRADEECLKVIQDNFDSFARLYICSKSNGKEKNAIYDWTNKLESLPYSLFTVSSKYFFHPKVYLFCNEDETQWQCFISSANFTKSDMVQAAIVLTNDDDPDEKNEVLFSIKKLFAIDYPKKLSYQDNHWITLPHLKTSYYSKEFFQWCLECFEERFEENNRPLNEWRKSDLLEILFFPQWQKICIHNKKGKLRKDLVNKNSKNAHKNPTPIYFRPTLLDKVFSSNDTQFWKLLSKITIDREFEKEDYIAFCTHVTKTYTDDIEPFKLLCQTTLILSILSPSIFPFIYSENSFLLNHLGNPSFKEDPFITYWNHVVLPCYLAYNDVDNNDDNKYDFRPVMLQYLESKQLKTLDFKKHIKDSFSNENRIGPSSEQIIEKYLALVNELFSYIPFKKGSVKTFKGYLNGKSTQELTTDTLIEDSVKTYISDGKKNVKEFLTNPKKNCFETTSDLIRKFVDDNDIDISRLMKYDSDLSTKYGKQYEYLCEIREEIRKFDTNSQ